jgi:hypothetical protein
MDEDNSTAVSDNDGDGMTMPTVDDGALVGAGQQDDHAKDPQAAVPVLQHAPVAPVPPVSGIPQAADDVDLIEKEWVEKAKQIVDSTVGDPYTQAKHLSQMKAEYVKKRYGRDVKTDD